MFAFALNKPSVDLDQAFAEHLAYALAMAVDRISQHAGWADLLHERDVDEVFRKAYSLQLNDFVPPKSATVLYVY